jgi:hypothetical protein
MQVSKQTTITLGFEPDELAAVTGALETYAERVFGAECKAGVLQLVSLLNSGEPLTGKQADDLRVYVVRYCKTTSGTDEMAAWPGLTGRIARQLQNCI